MNRGTIRQHVNKLLQEQHIDEPLVDVFSIARRLGIKVSLEDLENDVSGLLIIKNGSAMMAINMHHHPNRQRFSTAHEIGHFLLHGNHQDDLFIDQKVYHRNLDAGTGENKIEIEANWFASELLMPKFMLEKILRDHVIDIYDEFDTQQLAKIFGVSKQALGFRLANLNLINTY